MLCCTRKIIVIPFYSCGKFFPTSSGLGSDQLVPESTSSIAAAVSGLLWTSTFKSATKLFHSDFINRCSYIHIQYNYMHKKSRDITALLWCVILSYRIYLNCLPPGQLQSGPHLSEEGHPNFSEPFIQGRKELRIINNCYVQKYQYYCINIKCLLLLTYQTGKMNKKKYFTCSMLILRRGSGVPSLPPVDPLLPPPATSPPTTPPDMSYHYLYQPKPNILKERVNEALTRLGEYNI